MKYNHLSKWLIVALMFSANWVSAQVTENNQSDFNEFTYRQGSAYRAASGKPGPEYWQNKADYKIAVTLNEEEHIIAGKVDITYTNNSPESLPFVWLHLEQNRFKADSRGTLTTPIQGNRYSGDVDGGFAINNVEAKLSKRGSSVSSKHIISDTRMQVFLTNPFRQRVGKPQFL